MSIRTKNKLYLTYVNQKCLRNELRYNSYRNELNYTSRIAERNHYPELPVKHKSNLKTVWGVFKSIVNKHKAKRVQEKFTVHDDSVITDRGVINTRFNDYLIEIGPNLTMTMNEYILLPCIHIEVTCEKIPNPGINQNFT